MYTENWDNTYDNTEEKHIEVLSDKGDIESVIVATEYFAEAVYSGKWQVSQSWLAQQALKEQAELDINKAAANEVINKWRLTVNQTSFPFDGKQIACDALSRSDLDGMANYINLFSDFPPGFSHKWKCVDNTYLTFDGVEDFKDMYAAMVDTGNNNFIIAQQLKAKIAAATTAKEIETILGELP